MNKYTVTVAVSVIAIAAVGTYISHGIAQRPRFSLTTVQKSDVVQGVSTNGTVQAAQAVNLSFQGSGTISTVSVQAGDSVKSGQVLALLSSRDAHAAVDQASAAVAAAQANYSKVVNGATSQQAAVAQAALASAQTALANATAAQVSSAAQQATAVANDSRAMLNSGLAAIPAATNTDGVIAIITGTYTGTDQGAYNLVIYNTGDGPEFQAQGLENASGPVKAVPVPLGSKGLSIQFVGKPSATDAYTVSIPNTSSVGYVAATNVYQAALQSQAQAATAAQSAVDSARAAVDQAQASLNLLQTAARPEDVAAAQAQVSAAEASLEAAQSTESKTEIAAPFDGTITEVDAKVGQTASPGIQEVSMISLQKFQAVTYLSQSDLGKVNVGDPAQVTLDAYGSGTVFPATLAAIDPGATTVAGVPGYKVTLQFTVDDSKIRDGMAASMVITDATRASVLAVPSSAIFMKNSAPYVLQQDASGNIQQRAVQVGIAGLGGMVEVASGISQGDQVIYFGK